MHGRDDRRAVALAWFARLTPVPQAFALQELFDAPSVMATPSLAVMTGVPRERAEQMIRAGVVRRTPDGEPGHLAACRLVVIDPANGFPVRLQTGPL